MKLAKKAAPAFALILTLIGANAHGQPGGQVSDGPLTTVPTTITPVAFTDNGDGTVTHKITGLIWKRCAEGMTWTGSTCAGTAKGYTWTEANALSIGDGWRLPRIDELASIVERDQYNPSINMTIFPNTPSSEDSSRFWSALGTAGDMAGAWIVAFGTFSSGAYGSGNIGASNKSNYYSVRLVRGEQSLNFSGEYTPSSDFEDNGDGSVTHLKTSLIWKRCTEGQNWTGSTCNGIGNIYNWADANALSTSGGWRLPTQNELLTIVEWSKYEWAKNHLLINGSIFPNTPSNRFWSVSAFAGKSGDAWGFDFSNAYNYIYAKNYLSSVRLVRGEQSIGSASKDVTDIEFLPQYQTNAKRSASFSYGMARFAAKVADDAYGDTADVYANTLTANGFTVAPLVRSSGSSAVEKSLQAVVATKTVTINQQSRRVVLVAFRGTLGGVDWLVDLSANPMTYNPAAPGIQVHGGFLDSEKLFESLESGVTLNGISLSWIIGEAANNDDLFLITGHSLGGAIATLYTARLLDRGISRDRLQAYTFGAPSVGNADFQYVFFNDDTAQISKKMNLHRVRNKLDIVPFASYMQFLLKYLEIKGGALALKTPVSVGGEALAELFFRDATDNWPYMHVGYMRVLDLGVDFTSTYDEMTVFDSGVVLLASIFDGSGNFAVTPEHKMSTYLSNLESVQGQQVSNSGVLDAQGVASGAINARSINVLFNPAWNDIDQNGEVFLAAMMPDGQLYFYRRDGAWVLLDRAMGSNFPTYYSGTLKRMVISAINSIDLTPAIGAKLYVGYRLTGNPGSLQYKLISIVR